MRMTLAAMALTATVVLSLPSSAGALELDINGYFDDDNHSVHEQDIDSIAAAGITAGCNPPSNTDYCPTLDVTRGEMAAFLRRAKGLPFVTTDYFTDDNGSIFEDDINAIAADGITVGCGGGRYCPTVPMQRDEMAAMLARGLNLPPSSENHFVDDEGSLFESAINSIADAGVTLGCNPPENNLYCPDLAVSRGQMASFLTRAFDLPHVYIATKLDLVVPFSGDCDADQAICDVTLTLPRIDAYLIDEGWFYEAPFAPGDQEVFESGTTKFRVRLDGVTLGVTGTGPVTEGGLHVKRYTGEIPRLTPGEHIIVGDWFWNDTILYKTRLTLIVD